MNPEWGLNEYRICKAQNGYIVTGRTSMVGETLQDDFKMKVFKNLRTALSWLCREFGNKQLLNEMEQNINKK